METITTFDFFTSLGIIPPAYHASLVKRGPQISLVKRTFWGEEEFAEIEAPM